MKREVILRPTSVVSITPWNGCFPGSSQYTHLNTPSMTLAEVWADELNTTYYVPFDSDKGIVRLDPPPTLALFTKVTLSAEWDYSQGGPNNWYFPPDNSYGPRIRLILIGRDGVTEQAGSWYEAESTPNVPTNDNVYINPPGPFPGLYEQTWEMTAHPEGGPWTFDDLVNLKAGVECSMSNGPSGHPFDNSQGSFFKVRVVNFKVTLEVEDLGGFVDNVRHSSSLSLRLFRRARNAIMPRTFAHHAGAGVGSRVWLTHPRGPSVTETGWGRRRLERRAGLILRRTIYPEQFIVEDQVFDLRPYSCLGWGAYRIDAPWSPELQGMALLDKGAGYTHDRAQDAWSPRPGDGVLMRVLEDYPNLSEEGLAAQGGGDESICLRNYDLMQSGWSTVGDSGDFTASSDTTVSMVEEQGYLSAAKLEYGAAGGAGGRERSLGTLPYADGDLLHLHVFVRNTSVPTPASQNAEWALYRTGGGLAADEWWDDTNRTWTVTPTYNDVPSDEPYGQVTADAIPLDAGGASSDPTYYVRVGRFSSNLTSVTFHAALVDAQHTDDTVAGARSPLVTLDSPITRVADVHTLANSAAAELWDYERGTAVVEAWPFWRAEDLPTDAVRTLLHAEHATDTYDALQFVAKTGSDDLVRFERAVSGESTFQLDVAIDSVDLTRLHVLRAWVRWLGADGWDQFAPYSVEVGYAVFLKADGSLVVSGSQLGALAYTGDVAARDFLGIGTDGTSSHLDGRVRMWETRRNPLHGIECVWRV